MTVRLNQLLRSYHPLVWWVVGGTMLTTVTSFMVMPFMALYMAVHTKAAASTIGLVIGSAAITSVLFSLLGGSLSDRFGRKQMMLVSVALTILDMVGFANARSVWEFLVLSIFSGLSQALFQPATSALLTDVTAPEKRGDVFALRYWSINVGAAAGPILGGYFGTVATGWTFYLAAGTAFIYFVIIMIVFPGKKPAQAESASGGFLLRKAIEAIGKDKALFLFMIAGFASSLGYSQIDTNLPQHMAHTMDPLFAAKLFGLILASNAIEVVILQLPITRLVKRLSTISSMMTGQLIFAIGYLLIAFADAPWMYFVSMFVITVGEIVVFPQNSKYVSDLASETLRGAYFGASNMSYLGAFVGPWIGGMVLSRSGGMTLFIGAAIVVAAGTPFYRLSGNARNRVMTRKPVPHSKTVDP
jgi:MFS family permease